MGVAKALARLLALAAALVGTSFVPALQPMLPQLHDAASELWALVEPGGRLHPSGFIEFKGHIVVEGFLLVVISYLLFQSSAKPKQKKRLTEREIDELCEEWQPEPLHGALPEWRANLKEPVISSATGAEVTVNGGRALNLVSQNFLGIAGDAGVAAAARGTIDRYGVGSCGPRGFYGTIDVHLELEARLAALMGREEAILYSYDLATLPSIIPAFASKADIILMDEGCNYAIQNGCNLSRARVLTWPHNDAAALGALLARVEGEELRLKRPLTRRFIVVEGVYANSGDVAPLGAIHALKERYKYRLVVDESLSLGVLGPTGRGAAEHYGLSPGQVEIVGASLGAALSSVGGFCAGDREVVDHQRLSGLGYCFSASLPPYLATAAICALDILAAEGPARMATLRANAALFRREAVAQLGAHLRVVGGAGEGGGGEDGGEDDPTASSPVIHLRLHPVPDPKEYDAGDAALQRVADDALAREGLLLAVAKYTSLEARRPPPSLRVAVTAAHSPRQLAAAVAKLRASCRRVLG